MGVVDGKEQHRQTGHPAGRHEPSVDQGGRKHEPPEPEDAVKVHHGRVVRPQMVIHPMGQGGDGSEKRDFKRFAGPPGYHADLHGLVQLFWIAVAKSKQANDGIGFTWPEVGFLEFDAVDIIVKLDTAAKGSGHQKRFRRRWQLVPFLIISIIDP
jgi:hypothetical protein